MCVAMLNSRPFEHRYYYIYLTVYIISMLNASSESDGWERFKIFCGYYIIMTTSTTNRETETFDVNCGSVAKAITIVISMVTVTSKQRK